MAVPPEGNAEWFAVSSGFIYFVRSMESCVIALIILSFTSILVFFIVSKIQKDTKTKHPASKYECSEGVRKIQSSRKAYSPLLRMEIRLIGNCVFRVASFGLWLGILFFVVFVGLGLLGSRKERKREGGCDFAQRLFLLLTFVSFVCYTVYHRTSPSVGRSETAPSFALFSIGSNEY